MCAWPKEEAATCVLGSNTSFVFSGGPAKRFPKHSQNRLFWRNLANACIATLPGNTCNEPFLAANAHALAIFLSEAAAEAAALFHTDAVFLFTRRLQIPCALPFGAAASELEKVSD